MTTSGTRWRPVYGIVARTASANVAIAILGGTGGIILALTLGPADRGTLVSAIAWPSFFVRWRPWDFQRHPAIFAPHRFSLGGKC